MSVNRLAASVTLLVSVSAFAGGPTAPQSAHDLAQSLARKIADFEAQRKAGKPPREKSVPVTDGELSAYLNLAVKLPPSVSELDVKFDRDRVSAKGQLDLDQLQGKLPNTGMLGAFSILSGKVAVSVRGRLQNDDGFGTFSPEDVRIGSVPIAASVLEQIVATATRSADHPQGIDILAPFRYPYAIRQVRLQPGKAVLEF